ncbi:MAG: PAS domain S-box protein [Promethearchaeota archaeon]|nr:MAG: PAS domain S-box protein [Candidatus Lokiarchaeota archaeon]
MLHLTEDMIFKVDLNGKFLFVNDAMVNKLGYSREKLFEKSGLEIIHPEDHPAINLLLLDPVKFQAMRHFEFRFVKKSGGLIWVQTNTTIETNHDGVPIGIIGVARDISEDKQIKEELQKQRDEAQQYLDLAGVIFVALDTSGLVTLINKKGCEVLGYPEEEILGRNWFENFIPKNIRKELIPISKQLLTGEIEPVEYIENPILTKIGQERLIAWHNTFLKDSSGKIMATLSSGDDITDQKRMEKALIESEKRYRSLFANTALAIGISDRNGNILQWNEAMQQMFGWTDFTSGNVQDYYVNLDQRREIFKELKNSGRVENFEVQMKNRQGNPFWVSVSLQPITYEEKEAFLATHIDITARKKMETALVDSEKRY